MGVIKKRGITYAGGGGSAGGVNYSTTEQKTGRKWIDGSDIYQKTLYYQYLPNNSYVGQTVADLKYIIDYEGFAYHRSDLSNQRPLPFSGGSANDIRIDLYDGSIRIVTFSDWTAYAGYLTIYYTKTS